jgi:hypothetical protein
MVSCYHWSYCALLFHSPWNRSKFVLHWYLVQFLQSFLSYIGHMAYHLHSRNMGHWLFFLEDHGSLLDNLRIQLHFANLHEDWTFHTDMAQYKHELLIQELSHRRQLGIACSLEHFLHQVFILYQCQSTCRIKSNTVFLILTCHYTYPWGTWQYNLH